MKNRRVGRQIGLVFVAIFVTVYTVRAEIKDVMSSAEIDAILARSKQGEQILHERPNFSIVAGVREGQALAAETKKDAGTVIHLRKGSGKFTVANRVHDVAAGDVLHVPRNTPYQLVPASGRLEYLAIRVRDLGIDTPRGSGIGAPPSAARGSATEMAPRQTVPDGSSGPGAGHARFSPSQTSLPSQRPVAARHSCASLSRYGVHVTGLQHTAKGASQVSRPSMTLFPQIGHCSERAGGTDWCSLSSPQQSIVPSLSRPHV